MMHTSKSPYLSVVICTLDRYDDLTMCLDALRICSEKTRITHEVIVIDQTDAPARRLDIASRYDDVRCISQSDKGLSKARNLGFLESRGEIIAYLDDDAEPCADWIGEITAPFLADDSGKILACGGRVIADYRKGTKPTWMTKDLEHYLSCIDWGEKRRIIRPGEWIVGANMAFRRATLEKFDLFNVALGRKGTKHLLSNEEIGLLERIGHDSVTYCPSAIVLHIISSERLQQSWFRRRVYWQAVSDQIADIGWLSPEQAWLDLSTFIARSPAERRSVLALFQDCHDSELFALQLKAIYALITLSSQGLSLPVQAENFGR